MKINEKMRAKMLNSMSEVSFDESCSCAYLYTYIYMYTHTVDGIKFASEMSKTCFIIFGLGDGASLSRYS
jgi:hypothetical protein